MSRMKYILIFSIFSILGCGSEDDPNRGNTFPFVYIEEKNQIISSGETLEPYIRFRGNRVAGTENISYRILSDNNPFESIEITGVHSNRLTIKAPIIDHDYYEKVEIEVISQNNIGTDSETLTIHLLGFGLVGDVYFFDEAMQSCWERIKKEYNVTCIDT